MGRAGRKALRPRRARYGPLYLYAGRRLATIESGNGIITRYTYDGEGNLSGLLSRRERPGCFTLLPLPTTLGGTG